MEPGDQTIDVQVHPHLLEILKYLEDPSHSDFSNTLPTHWDGIAGDLARAINRVTENQANFSREFKNAFITENEMSHTDAMYVGLHTGLMTEVIDEVSRGTRAQEILFESLDDMRKFNNAVTIMINTLQEAGEREKLHSYILDEISDLNHLVDSPQNLAEIYAAVLEEMAKVVSLKSEHFYEIELMNGNLSYQLLAKYPSSNSGEFDLDRVEFPASISRLASQNQTSSLKVEAERYFMKLHEAPDGVSHHLSITPFSFNDRLNAVLVIVSDEPLTRRENQYLEKRVTGFESGFNNIKLIQRTRDLLAKSNELALEMQIANQKLLEISEILKKQARNVEELNVQLDEKARSLGEISKYKTQFLAYMSHELRTPLTSLLILASLLVENPKHHLDEKEVGFAKMIKDSGEELLELVNDILVISKIETGKISFNPTEVLIEELTRKISKVCTPISNDKKLEFHISLASDLPSHVVIDELRVRQVINNLLFNAFKFTPEGMVSLRIENAQPNWKSSVVGSADLEPALRFVVTDTGIGIAEVNRKVIFEMFHQGDGAVERTYGGTGLGLSISHDLAEIMGGKLMLTESSPNKGSTFEFIVPIGLKVNDVLETEVITPKDFDGKRATAGVIGRKILIVDDDSYIRFALTALLESHGINVISCESGISAIEYLENSDDVDLVLMDLMMPIMSGYEAINRIVESDKIKYVPIIAITARLTLEEEKRCIEAGAMDYLAKPIDIERLLAAVEKWVS